MENRRIVEAKKSSSDSKLAEIEKQGKLVTMEAKIEALEEMIEAKNQRLTLVNEDENLSELIDKKKVKEMQKEIKLLEKQKSKLEKMYEKACGSKRKEVLDETDDVEEELMTPNEEAGEAVEAESTSGAFEESVNEEFSRFKKLAGL
jgi:Spy/CpxP family protein refolding chaperone